MHDVTREDPRRFYVFRKEHWLAELLSAVVLAIVAGCTGSSGGGSGSSPATLSTAGVSITIEFAGQMTPSALNAQPLTATASDVVSVTIDVTQGANVLQAGVPLTLSGSTWSGAIGNLPATVPLTFTAHAYDFTHTEIYSGSDTTTLSAMALNSVAINLALIPGGILALPQIVSIRLPSLIASATSATIQVQVAGSANDTLTWSLTAPTGGGSFNPASGSQTLSASGTGSFSVTFIAPVLLSTYTETVQVTNSQNNGVLATFPIQVSGVAGVVTLQFPPVVTGILGSRSGSTLTWTASALGDLSCCDFTWSASLTGGIAPGFGAPATTNPAFLEGYDQTVSGTIFVQVSDGTGLSSTAILGLPAGEFPDALVVPLSLNEEASATRMLPQGDGRRSARFCKCGRTEPSGCPKRSCPKGVGAS